MKSRTLIFSASAGSGKTFNLAVQYIALLTKDASAHEFAGTLAVTFTNKATAEMKDRILEQLYGIGHGLAESESYLRCVQDVLRKDYKRNISDPEVRARCRKALSAILHGYSRFNVCTIDTFFQGVLRNMAHELGLNARLQVDLSNNDVAEMAIDNLIEGLGNTDKELLPWLRSYIMGQIKEEKKWDVRKKLRSMSLCLFKEEYLRRSLDSGRNKPFTLKNVGDFKEALERKKGEVFATCKEKAKAFEDILAEEGLGYEALSFCKDIKNCVGNFAEGRMEKVNFGIRLCSMIDDPMIMLKTKDRKNGKLRTAVARLSGALSGMKEAHSSALQWLVSIDKILESLTPMGAFDAIDGEIRRINKENNRFALAHTPIILRRMIGEEDAPFVFEKMGTRYRNIMIDEFQDTSMLQWENFSILIKDIISRGGLNIFVGDVKQSIYRWRNGDWHILHRLQEDNPGNTVRLDTNRRSKGNIVSFNNAFFLRASERLDTIVPHGETQLKYLYRGVEQKVAPDKEDGGYVRISVRSTENKVEWEEEMLRDMYENIVKLKEKYGVPYNEMAILIRKKRYIEPVIKYFSSGGSGVKVVSDEAFYLSYSVAANVIINALEVLSATEGGTQSGDVSLPLRYVMGHCCLGDGKKGVAASGDYTLDEPSSELKERFIDRAGQLLRLPLYELCEELYRRLCQGMPEEQDAYLLSFFDELKAFLDDNPSDIASFLSYWDETMKDKAIPAGNIDGVRIMTIHSAKGLQYHTVLVPYCDYQLESENSGDFLWCTPKVRPLDTMGTLPISMRKSLETSFFASDYARERAEKRADELNVLYVAFTRAEDNLLVWGRRNKGAGAGEKLKTVGDLMAECLSLAADVYELGEPSPHERKGEAWGNAPQARTENRMAPNRKTENIRMCSYEGKADFLQSSRARAFVAEGGACDGGGQGAPSSYIEEGKLLHYVFSRIGTRDDIPKVLGEMLEQGILDGKEMLGEVSGLLRRGLEKETVSDWFSGAYRLFNECSLLREKDGKLEEKRPDRVMIGDGVAIVVDFKFGRMKSEDYDNQVRGYMEILQDMHPDKSVTGYIWYVYLDEIVKI